MSEVLTNVLRNRAERVANESENDEFDLESNASQSDQVFLMFALLNSQSDWIFLVLCILI